MKLKKIAVTALLAISVASAATPSVTAFAGTHDQMKVIDDDAPVVNPDAAKEQWVLDHLGANIRKFMDDMKNHRGFDVMKTGGGGCY